MRVSVVIPTWNCAPWLPACLGSVFAQTWRDFEVVVVDDGSTDDTAEALGPWVQDIRYIRQPNRGVAAARNAAIGASSGEWIALLDADDLWAPHKLERQIAAFDANPRAGLVCSDFSIEPAVASYFRERGGYDTGRVFSRIVRDCFIFTSTVMLRRSLLDELGPFDESISYCDDYNMWLRAALRTEVATVPEVLCMKRERAGNARSFDATTACWIGALRNLFTQTPDMSAAERRLVRGEIARLERSFGRHCLSRRQLAKAVVHYSSALSHEIRAR